MALFRRPQGIDARTAAVQVEHGDALLLDVREHDEWHAGHTPGAVHIPLGELAERLPELPHNWPVVAVCRSGNRSALATDALRRAGLQAENLEGGMKAWQKAGLPLEPTDGRVA